MLINTLFVMLSGTKYLDHEKIETKRKEILHYRSE